jgi:hypothetical protein
MVRATYYDIVAKDFGGKSSFLRFKCDNILRHYQKDQIWDPTLITCAFLSQAWPDSGMPNSIYTKHPLSIQEMSLTK